VLFFRKEKLKNNLKFKVIKIEWSFTNPACSFVVRHLATGKQQSGKVSIRVGVWFVRKGFIKL
jgi:hypothetical protein